jgi:hypothetical protein
MWLGAVAAGCGILHGPSTTVDDIKGDVELVRKGYWRGTWNPTVRVQVKTSADLREVDDHFAYNLDIETYNVLRRTNESVRRILVVIRLARTGERVRLVESGTLLVGRGAWVSLEGRVASTNTTSQVVMLPMANTLDRSGLERMLKTYGVRSSTPVPPIDVWGKS